MESAALPTPAPHCVPTSRPQVTKWPAMKKWSRAYLKKAFKGGMVRPRIASRRGCFIWQLGVASMVPHPKQPQTRCADPHIGLGPCSCSAAMYSPRASPYSLPQVLVGDQPIPFDSYCKYADTNTDELPLYL